MQILDERDHRMIAFVPTILSSYVAVLGQQNGYRQYTSFVLFLWAIALCIHHKRLSFVLFVVSFLTHNVTAVLFGYWLDTNRRQGRKYGPIVTLSGVVVLEVLWPFLRKSSSYTGLDTSFWYICLAGGILALLYFCRGGRLIGEGRGADTVALYNYLAFAPAIRVLASDQFERVSMYFLILILLDLNRHRGRVAVRGPLIDGITYSILVLPVFMFGNVYAKLL